MLLVPLDLVQRSLLQPSAGLIHFDEQVSQAPLELVDAG